MAGYWSSASEAPTEEEWEEMEREAAEFFASVPARIERALGPMRPAAPTTPAGWLRRVLAALRLWATGVAL